MLLLRPQRVPTSSNNTQTAPRSLEARLSDGPRSTPAPDTVDPVGAQVQALDDIVEQFRNEEIDSTAAFRAIRDRTFHDPVVSQDYISQIMDIQREQLAFRRE